ncbi:MULTISPECIES: hypothetical protein [unclassified Streptomyces]|uniref:hypothetical protein n=1 Tax=unclassified Streptomyces TaxID=2593676 RepID=UPI0036F4C6C7
MQAETLAGLMGLAGAVVGAAVSTGAVIWQQRKIAHEAERTHLLGLAEAAANEVIRLSYELQDHFPKMVDDPFNSGHWAWVSHLEMLNRSLEQQSLRFADPKVRYLLAWIQAEIVRDPIRLGRDEVDGYPSAPYLTICADMRTVMGAVLRRQPFPEDIWTSYEDTSPPL